MRCCTSAALLESGLLHGSRFRKQFPTILESAGITVEKHHELFQHNGTDEEWLEYCGTKDRVAITHNERIRYTPNELAAVVQHKVRLLVVIGHAPFLELAHNFVNTRQKIEAFLNTNNAPFIPKIYRPSPGDTKSGVASPGHIVRWYP